MDPIDQLVSRASPQPASATAEQLREFLALLRKWNVRVNLTASTEWEAVGSFFEEAVWAARLYPREATVHLDIGSGAGFPALLLRILIPRLRLDLVESRTKRSLFLETVVRELGLDGVRVIHDRLDRFLAAEQRSWDCISWKGLKLNTRDLAALVQRSGAETRFWMFHGREPAVSEPRLLNSTLVLERREACPARPDWWLSEYRKAGESVSRET